MTKHYFSRFEEAVKNNWERPALANFRGESFTFGELATQIAKFHVFFETIGLKKGDKVVTVGGIYGTVDEIKDNSVLIIVDRDVKIRVSKQALVKDFTDTVQ
mgnify:CR=1 FL=1